MGRPLGVVFTRERIPEIDQDAVAHIARDEARETPHDLGYCVMIGANQVAKILGVAQSRKGGRADEVAEHTVSCRRSPPAALATGSEAVLLRSAEIAASNLRRCPTRSTPMSLRSSAVSSGNTDASIALSRNAWSYCCNPRPWSQLAMSTRVPQFGPRRVVNPTPNFR